MTTTTTPYSPLIFLGQPRLAVVSPQFDAALLGLALLKSSFPALLTLLDFIHSDGQNWKPVDDAIVNNSIEGIGKKVLSAMPESERTLLLLLGHASNEINVLSKLILMMRKEPAPSVAVDQVEAGQVFIIMRLLIGKLHEAWELFKTRFQSNSPLALRCIPQLQPEGVQALDALKRYFGQSSSLTAIRNKVAFHYTDKDNLTGAAFQQIGESEPLQFYLAKTVGNSFYHASELIAQVSAINLTKGKPDESDPSNSMHGAGAESVDGWRGRFSPQNVHRVQ